MNDLNGMGIIPIIIFTIGTASIIDVFTSWDIVVILMWVIVTAVVVGTVGVFVGDQHDFLKKNMPKAYSILKGNEGLYYTVVGGKLVTGRDDIDWDMNKYEMRIFKWWLFRKEELNNPYTKPINEYLLFGSHTVPFTLDQYLTNLSAYMLKSYEIGSIPLVTEYMLEPKNIDLLATIHRICNVETMEVIHRPLGKEIRESLKQDIKRMYDDVAIINSKYEKITKDMEKNERSVKDLDVLSELNSKVFYDGLFEDKAEVKQSDTLHETIQKSNQEYSAFIDAMDRVAKTFDKEE